MRFSRLWIVAGLFLLWSLGGAGRAMASPVETGSEFPWNVSVTAGSIGFEGDEWAKDGIILGVHLGYDFSPVWTVEGVAYLAPSLDANRHREDGLPTWDSTYLVAGAVDGLCHFTRWKRFDPYLALGVQASHYSEEQKSGDSDEFVLRGGGGAMWHFNDEWALRADFRGMLAGFGQDSEANTIVEAGVVWTWGAHVPPKFQAAGGALDSDADGLTDAEEIGIYKTDPLNADTDGDGLGDYQEVKVYKTDPRNPDSDWDGLTDGAEVLTYKTNPLDRDTDKGGVADGHEVIEDGTNPLNPADDLILYTLNIQFDYNKEIIKPEFFRDCDVVGKVLARDPGATARIEGHADKLKDSKADYNMSLSERRAQAVVKYLAQKFDIEPSRLKAVGYGFTRPKAPNDRVNGNPVNRRVEVYITPSDHASRFGAKAATTNAVVRDAIATPVTLEEVKTPAEPKAASSAKAVTEAKPVAKPATTNLIIELKQPADPVVPGLK